MFFKSKPRSEQPPAPGSSTQQIQGKAAQSSLSPEQRKRRADYSHVVMQAFGAAVAVFMRSKTHRQMRLADIEGIVSPAVSCGQFLLAETTHKQNGLVTPIGVVLWARVSPEIDARIARDLEQPLKLAPSEWSSGDIVWIVEAVGAPPAINKLVQELKETSWKGKTVKMRARDKDNKVAVREIA